ncbi:hypothetical protein C5167_026386 [Papaver somniferum]|nr:hypothetical protein C5167_026386 [Papaver somniferum]
MEAEHKEIESSQIRTHTNGANGAISDIKYLKDRATTDPRHCSFSSKFGQSWPNYNSGKVSTLSFLEIIPATKAIASFKLPTTILARGIILP